MSKIISYELVEKNLPKIYKGKEDPLLHCGESWELAKGDGWKCLIVACGEVRAHKNGKLLAPWDLSEEYATDKELEEAEKKGELNIDYNNWYELQFFCDTGNGLAFLDLTPDLVAFSFGECIEQFEELMKDKEFCDELMAGVKNNE